MSLSVDNLFVFILLFSRFKVPSRLQRRVLLYGVLGAIVLRFLVIISGTWLVNQFHWILYVFGAFLFVSGVNMLRKQESQNDITEHPVLRFIGRHIRITPDYHDENFFIRCRNSPGPAAGRKGREQPQDGLLHATPLFLVLVMIELSDLIFAFDSIPAIFSVTSDSFIIFTSNMLAIMGLRALYFLLAHMASRFYLLKYGIALLICLVGLKMMVSYWIHMPVTAMLVAIVSILGTTMLLSGWARRR